MSLGSGAAVRWLAIGRLWLEDDAVRGLPDADRRLLRRPREPSLVHEMAVQRRRGSSRPGCPSFGTLRRLRSSAQALAIPHLPTSWAPGTSGAPLGMTTIGGFAWNDTRLLQRTQHLRRVRPAHA